MRKLALVSAAVIWILILAAGMATASLPSWSESWEGYSVGATAPYGDWNLQAGTSGVIAAPGRDGTGVCYSIAAGQISRIRKWVKLDDHTHIVLQGWLKDSGSASSSMLGLAGDDTLDNNSMIRIGTNGSANYQVEYYDSVANPGAPLFTVDTGLPREAGWHFVRLDLIDTGFIGLFATTFHVWNAAMTVEKQGNFVWWFNKVDSNYVTLGSPSATANAVQWDDIQVGPATGDGAIGEAPITVGDPSDSESTGGSITYLVTYGQASNVTLSAADITLNRIGTANGTVDVSGTGATRTITISNITGCGTLGISLAAGTAAYSSGPITTAPAVGPCKTFMVNVNIRRWAVIGHYAWDNGVSAGSTRWTKDFFDAPGISETGVWAKTGLGYATSVSPGSIATWTPYTSPTAQVDFNSAGLYNTPTTYTQYGVSYMFDYVVNSGPAITGAYLTCGSDDGIKVWVNGVLKGGADLYRGLKIDGDIYPASGGFTLNPGVNTLLVKVTQGTGTYVAQARICDAGRTVPAWLSQLTYVQSDDTPPTPGSPAILINGGATTGQSYNVTLTLSATDDLSGVSKMSFSDDGSFWQAPVPYTTGPYAYTLPDGLGAKTVYVKFIDRVGNESSGTDSATITLSGNQLTVNNCAVGGFTGGTPTGAGGYGGGATVNLHANPKPGYAFQKWTTDGCGGYDVASTNPDYSFTMPGADYQLFANYTANSYTLTTHNNDPAHGSVGGDSGSKETNASCTVTATATDPNYRFKNWTTNSAGTAQVSTDASYTFVMPPNNYQLWANFEYMPLLTLQDTPPAGGTASGGGRFAIGSSVTASTTANPGYRLYGWSSDAGGLTIVSTANPYTFTMPAADLTLYAQYVPADLIFEDSFENGLDAWTPANAAGAGEASIATTGHNVGTHALMMNVGGQRVLRNITGLAAATPKALRLWINDPGPDALKLIYADMRVSGSSQLFGISSYSGAAFYQSRGPTTAINYLDMPLAARIYGPPTNPAGDVWNRVDIASNGVDTAKYYVNGVLTQTLTGFSAGLISQVYLGNGFGTTAMDAVYYDDVALFTNPRLLTTGVSPTAAGSVTGAQHGSPLKGATTGCYYANEPIKLTATPAPGKAFVKWTDGAGAQLSTSVDYNVLMPGSDTTVIAVFQDADSTPPTGTIVINGGETTNSTSVTLTLSASDVDDAVTTMTFSNDGATWSTPVDAYGTSKAWTLSTGDGLKTVYVKFTDSHGNTSVAYSDTINLSTCSAPTGTTDVPGNKISSIWALPNDATVYKLTGKMITAVWSDGFWIEESNRTAGIKVLYDSATACTIGAPIAIGDIVDVYGTFSTGDMRQMTASVVSAIPGSHGPVPVMVTEKYIGGKQANVTTPAVTGGKGIYEVGLLVKIAGNIAQVGSDYYLNTIRLISLTTPPTGNKVVTGVIGIVGGSAVIYATDIQ